MAKKTTKLWAVSPTDDTDKALMASFVLTDGKLEDSSVPDPEIKDLVERGLFDGNDMVTLESDAATFVKMLSGNYAMSSFVYVDITED
jgi:hypothetical protein